MFTVFVMRIWVIYPENLFWFRNACGCIVFCLTRSSWFVKLYREETQHFQFMWLWRNTFRYIFVKCQWYLIFPEEQDWLSFSEKVIKSLMRRCLGQIWTKPKSPQCIQYNIYCISFILTISKFDSQFEVFNPLRVSNLSNPVRLLLILLR